MTPTTGSLPAEDINLALRLYRRLLLRILAIVGLGLVGVAVLAKISPIILPPRGRIGGMGLVDWGLIALVILVAAEIFWDGTKIGRALKDPMMRFFPLLGLMSLPTIIAQRANAIGMQPSRFMGPLKPIVKK
jgi:hypothetical protein